MALCEGCVTSLDTGKHMEFETEFLCLEKSRNSKVKVCRAILLVEIKYLETLQEIFNLEIVHDLTSFSFGLEKGKF